MFQNYQIKFDSINLPAPDCLFQADIQYNENA